MAATHHCLLYHIVFSTKGRKRYLQPLTRNDTFAYLGGVCKGLDAIPLSIGGWFDHVHLLVKLTTKHRLTDFMRELKANSSKHINETSGLIEKFAWQDGYGAFTVGRSQEDSVRRYIESQEVHHQKETFETEYISLLERSGIVFDQDRAFD